MPSGPSQPPVRYPIIHRGKVGPSPTACGNTGRVPVGDWDVTTCIACLVTGWRTSPAALRSLREVLGRWRSPDWDIDVESGDPLDATCNCDVCTTDGPHAPLCDVHLSEGDAPCNCPRSTVARVGS